MKSFAVADVKTHLSSILKEVEAGHDIGITFGKKKETIAVIIPIEEYHKIKKREIGTLKGKATVEFAADFKMTDEELLNS